MACTIDMFREAEECLEKCRCGYEGYGENLGILIAAGVPYDALGATWEEIESYIREDLLREARNNLYLARQGDDYYTFFLLIPLANGIAPSEFGSSQQELNFMFECMLR
jgi:hypothetical protein